MHCLHLADIGYCYTKQVHCGNLKKKKLMTLAMGNFTFVFLGRGEK